MSNNGRVGVGVIACRESMPDVDDLAQRFPAELERLREAVRARDSAVTPITKAKKAKA
jgi:diacylglycerol O-acyltransferase